MTEQRLIALAPLETRLEQKAHEKIHGTADTELT